MALFPRSPANPFVTSGAEMSAISSTDVIYQLDAVVVKSTYPDSLNDKTKPLYLYIRCDDHFWDLTMILRARRQLPQA